MQLFRLQVHKAYSAHKLQGALWLLPLPTLTTGGAWHFDFGLLISSFHPPGHALGAVKTHSQTISIDKTQAKTLTEIVFLFSPVSFHQMNNLRAAVFWGTSRDSELSLGSHSDSCISPVSATGAAHSLWGGEVSLQKEKKKSFLRAVNPQNGIIKKPPHLEISSEKF